VSAMTSSEDDRLLDAVDITELLDASVTEHWMAVKEVQKYLDEAGDKAIRQMHRNCATLSTFWDHSLAYQNGMTMTLCQFWRIAAIVGLTQLATLAELSRDVNPVPTGRKKPAPPPLRKLSVADLALGLAKIASTRTTCVQVAVQYGRDRMFTGIPVNSLAERLAVLVGAINKEVGRLIDAGEPLDVPGQLYSDSTGFRATELFRKKYARGVKRVLAAMCDDAGTAPLFAVRKILLIVESLSPNLSSKRVIGTAAIAAQALATAAPRPPAKCEVLELMCLGNQVSAFSSASRMRVTADEVLEAFARFACGARPDVDRVAAIEGVWRPFLSSEPSAALAQDTLLSFLQPAAGTSSDLRLLLRNSFLHYASFGWHNDASSVAQMEMRHASWRAIKTQLGLQSGIDSIDDAAFYACAVGGVTSLADDAKDTPAVLEEHGLLSALRMLGARSVLASKLDELTDDIHETSKPSIASGTAASPPPPAPPSPIKSGTQTQGMRSPSPPAEEEEEEVTGGDASEIARLVDEVIMSHLSALTSRLGLKTVRSNARDRMPSIDVCNVAAMMLQQHPESLSIIFQAYAEPLAPREATYTGSLAADADFYPGFARDGDALSKQDVTWQHALEAELRGVGPHALKNLIVDFALAESLRCDAATASQFASQMGGRPLSLVQLIAVLLRMAQHGAKAIMTRQSFEEDGVPSVKESGNWTGLYSPSTPSTSHTSTAMEVDQSDNESEVSSKGIGGELGHSAERTANFLESAIVNRPAHIALDQVLVHVVTKVLLLEQPVSVRCRLLCMGRRLSAVSVLLPLPPRPLLMPSSGMEGLRLSQEQLARRLHALIALADLDDVRLWGPAVSVAAQATPPMGGDGDVSSRPSSAPTTSNYAATASRSIINVSAARMSATPSPLTAVMAPYYTPSLPARRPRALLRTTVALSASASDMPVSQAPILNASEAAGTSGYPSLLRPPSWRSPPTGYANVAGMSVTTSVPSGVAGNVFTATIARTLTNTDAATSVPVEATRLLFQKLEAPPLPAEVARLVHEASLYSADGDLGRALAALHCARVLLLKSSPQYGQLSKSSSMASISTSTLPDFEPPYYPPRVAIFFELSMARACSACRQLARALHHAGSAFFIAILLEPGDVLCHAEIACCLGSICCELRRYAVAGALFARALEGRASHGCPALLLAEALNNLAVCTSATGDIPTAVQLYRDCHKLMILEVQPGHESVARVLHNLSRQLRMSGASLTNRPPVNLRGPLLAPPVLAFQLPRPPPGKKGKKGGKKGGGKKGKGGKKKK